MGICSAHRELDRPALAFAQLEIRGLEHDGRQKAQPFQERLESGLAAKEHQFRVRAQPTPVQPAGGFGLLQGR